MPVSDKETLLSNKSFFSPNFVYTFTNGKGADLRKKTKKENPYF